MNDLQELINAFDMVLGPAPVEKQYRLYYNTDGSIVGMWENDFPTVGEYLVLDHPDQFHCTNTAALRVVDGKLIQLDLRIPVTAKIEKADAGQPVVRGMAGIPLNEYEQFENVEYYDRKSNN